MDAIKLLLDGGAKVEAVNNVGPAAAAAPGGARTARTTPPTATTTKTMTTTAFPSPRARNCRNRRVVTLARVPRRNDVMSRENRDFAPRVRGTVRVVSSVASQRPVSEVAPRLSSRTFSSTLYPRLRGDHAAPPQRSPPRKLFPSLTRSLSRALLLSRASCPLRAPLVVVLLLLLLLRRRRARPRRRRRLRASHRSTARRHSITPQTKATWT